MVNTIHNRKGVASLNVSGRNGDDFNRIQFYSISIRSIFIIKYIEKK